MLRKIIVTVCIILCFVLQCSVFDSLSFAGIIPNLMIVLTSSFGFMRGEREGLVIGFFCGLLSDIFFGGFLGFYALHKNLNSKINQIKKKSKYKNRKKIKKK